MARLKDIIPLLSSTQYKKAQVLARYDDERYIDGYETKQEQFISGYGTKTEQYIKGYQKKSVTELQGDDPYNYNAYTNNKVGCTTNKYATSASLSSQGVTGTTCKLINHWAVEVNEAYISILSRCVESITAVNYHLKNSNERKLNGASGSVYETLDRGSGGAEDRKEYKNPVRASKRLGVYNPKSTGARFVTRQVDDKSRPIYASRQVTDRNKPIYGSRTVTDHNKPIYKTRKVPVYEERWVEE